MSLYEWWLRSLTAQGGPLDGAPLELEPVGLEAEGALAAEPADAFWTALTPVQLSFTRPWVCEIAFISSCVRDWGRFALNFTRIDSVYRARCIESC